MADKTFLVPGSGYVNITASRTQLIPGSGYVNETVSAGGGDVSVNLAGLAGTAEIGAHGVLHANALAGLEATGAAGSVAAARAHELTGQEATAAAGSIATARTHALAGLEATGATGSVALLRTHALTGLEATAAGGSITPYATQLAWPASDVTDGSWTPVGASDLYATLDEGTASDLDYDTSTDPSADMFEVKFGALTDPTASTGHIVRYRIGGVDGSVNFIVSLMNGAFPVATWLHNGVTDLTTYEQTLELIQADAITDYADLRLQFTATKV